MKVKVDLLLYIVIFYKYINITYWNYFKQPCKIDANSNFQYFPYHVLLILYCKP